jgi:hypothetical protein
MVFWVVTLGSLGLPVLWRKMQHVEVSPAGKGACYIAVVASKQVTENRQGRDLVK